MNGNTIYHVRLGDDEHYYFGSVAAIYDRFTPEQLGVSLSRLWSFGIAPGRPYKNKRCTTAKRQDDEQKKSHPTNRIRKSTAYFTVTLHKTKQSLQRTRLYHKWYGA